MNIRLSSYSHTANLWYQSHIPGQAAGSAAKCPWCIERGSNLPLRKYARLPSVAKTIRGSTGTSPARSGNNTYDMRRHRWLQENNCENTKSNRIEQMNKHEQTARLILHPLGHLASLPWMNTKSPWETRAMVMAVWQSCFTNWLLTGSKSLTWKRTWQWWQYVKMTSWQQPTI